MSAAKLDDQCGEIKLHDLSVCSCTQLSEKGWKRFFQGHVSIFFS